MRGWLLFVLCFAVAPLALGESPYSRWERGPSSSEAFFPVGVWLQNVSWAGEYRAIGVNVYVALYRGPTAEQLSELEKNGIVTVCRFTPALVENKTIIGWMHGDEPDNAQSLGRGKGYGPPVLPEKVVADYQRIREGDRSRPVFLNLGQGVAYDNYIGRGVRRGKMEDYPKYIEGSDVVSFDIYPVVNESAEVAGKLWYVPRGVSRLREWSKDQKVVWNCIETTRISSEKVKPGPAQVKAEVWMSLIHGSRGIIYFSHQFKPNFIEAGLLADAEMAKAVGEINAEIKALAPVLNAPVEELGVKVESTKAEVPVAFMARRHLGKVYVFAVGMREGSTEGRFVVPGVKGRVKVIGEGREIELREGGFEDGFSGYGVHLYEVEGK